MSFDLLDEDPHDSDPPLRTRLARRVLGDPKKAPGRLLYLLIFGLIALIVFGVWSVIQTQSSPSTSSYWVIRTFASVFNTMWVLVPVAFYIYWKYVGMLRNRHANRAADVTGWLPASIKHLSDEMRSTDGTTRVISTTDHSPEEIRENVDAALRGETHASEKVDYYGRRADDGAVDVENEADDEVADEPLPLDDGPSDLERVDELEKRERELVAEYNELVDEIDERFDDALDAELSIDETAAVDDTVSMYDLMDDASQEEIDAVDDLMQEAEAIEDEIEEIRSEIDALLEGVLDDDAVDETAQPDTDTVTDNDTNGGPDEEFDTFDEPDENDDFDDEVYIEPVGEADNASRTLGDVWNDDYPSRRAKVSAAARHCSRTAVDKSLNAASAIISALVWVWTTAKLVVFGYTGLDAWRDLLWNTSGDDEQTAEETDNEEEWDIPWKVRFAEELKHLILDLSAGLHSDEILWKFGVPAGTSFVAMLLVAKLWVNPLLYPVFAAASILIGLFVFWLSKKRRSRRLRIHRGTDEWSYWDDAAGRVKTVHARDVTCYMGWLSGRRYASYNREEFVREFGRRLHQHTHDERVSPSVLEQYARNIAQMKPNLRGHLEQIELPTIQREIKHEVEASRDQVIDKASLAMTVIEHPNEGKRLASDLGHDPRLVAQEYRWMVEEGHVLSEVDVEFEDASGNTTTKTLVYPSEKTRLPDMEALHSQFSDRFTGAHGDPYYTLPDCTPTDDLRGYVPSPKAADLFRTESDA